MRKVLLIALPLLAVSPAYAQTATQDAVDRAVRGVAGAVMDDVFTPEQRKKIDDYFKNRRTSERDDAYERGGKKHGKDKGGLPPGLAKKDKLPPGLAKRDTLPPGLAKRALPSDLDRLLGSLPKDRERSIVGDDVVLIDTATNVILDILKGAAKP
jgi:hypothetical protein